jgi:hypothetical protein
VGFLDNGFVKGSRNEHVVCINNEAGVFCADTHGGNILVSETGDMAAIDVPVMRLPA